MDLIQRCASGDEAAARALHDEYSPGLFRLAYLLLQDTQDAEEATQDAFVYAFSHLKRYDPTRAPFGSWLKVIVASRCRDLQRKRRWQWLSLQSLLEGRREPRDEQPAHQPESALERSATRRVVWEALQGLPRKSREALILRYYGGLSFDEMARALDCSINTAKSRVAYGQARLAELLDTETVLSLGYEVSP
ncbi:MAG: sigma-70 family RNA polymerase sigma factor [Thermoflexales bacterium]|nr:sigma-70 family RNA polymerase sigma factor [Thermoflexales bacterium]